jgi:outer membrane protein assembly factor BamD (BamD/ComL family)
MIAIGLSIASGLFASDKEASEKYRQGLQEFKSGNYTSAADKFIAAEKLADTVSMKADALKEAVKTYNKAGLYYKEFETIEKLLTGYASYVNYGEMVDREFQIGTLYYNGHRDPAFWSLRWIPWLTGPDKTIDIFKKALKNAPFAKAAPAARLQLAVIFIEKSENEKALKLLRAIIKNHPDTKECKFAYLELGNALFELSKKGDGDGKYNSDAVKVFGEFLKKYPKAPEGDWVRKCLLKSKDIQAKRLLNIAKFYHRIGRNAPAERYLNKVMMKYPDSLSAENSEELLVKIDKTYSPEGFRPELKSRLQKYPVIPIPPEPSPIIVVPENSDNKWLLPIRDVGLGRREHLKPKNKEQ